MATLEMFQGLRADCPELPTELVGLINVIQRLASNAWSKGQDRRLASGGEPLKPVGGGDSAKTHQTHPEQGR